MARLNEDGQWIVMMGFIVSIIIFILAVIVAESVLVGKTTSESVLEFPKTDIQDLRNELLRLRWNGFQDKYKEDISAISQERKNAVIKYSTSATSDARYLIIHYNNGITTYNEIYEEFY